MIANDATVRRNETLLWSDVGDAMVMMDAERGSYYILEGAAGRIWALLEHPTTISELCERLLAEHEVSADQCRSDVHAFIEDLSDRNIVQLAT